MATQVTTKRMTAEEFFDFVHRPENENKWLELVRGEVIELPRPTRPHGVVCTIVSRLLMNYTYEVGRFYAASNDSGVILERDPDTVRGPDVAVYDDANKFEELHPKWGEVAPLLAVEVLSPNDKANKVLQKVRDYLQAGTKVVWLIDPEDRTVTVHRPGQQPAPVAPDGDITAEDVLPGFRCRVADFFRLPGDKPPAA
jgi:Uma2 family endonuclease